MDLKEIQTIELEIFKQVLIIIDKHGLNAYLVGGTAIGAVRHGGFIPWDDDIDIAMLRDEYEKAREYLIEELPEDYVYCDNRTDSNYPYNFGKVRKRNTAFVHGGDSHLNIHHGIYIDIFPLDKGPSSESECARQIRKIRRLRFLNDLGCMSYRHKDSIRPIWQLPIIFFAKRFVNSVKLRNTIDRECQKYADAKTNKLCSFLGLYGEKEIFPTSWFEQPCKVYFENIKCGLPTNWDDYLQKIYGDYMVLPPEEKRVSHHDVIYLSDKREYMPKSFK